MFLFNRSIAAEQLDKINSELESDVMIRAIHDVKGIDMGNSLVRYKVGFSYAKVKNVGLIAISISDFNFNESLLKQPIIFFCRIYTVCNFKFSG